MGIFQFFKRKNSSNMAKDRLKLLLISDRVDCSTETIEMIKNDLIKVISKYIEIEPEGMDVQIKRTKSGSKNTGVPALYANIPIKDLRYHV
ncbi:MAG TPA: cell division topological specificity factor MinE [Lachnospiraceae bacterium]|jgi:cell division topological specificity factor|nr:cell division topological specificity factor MinE [Lachnospiraceae bacterium]